MKISSLIMVFILALFCASSAIAAPDRTGRWDLGVKANAAFPEDSDVETGGEVIGSISYGAAPWLGLGFSSGYVWSSVEDETVLGINISGPDISGVPLFGDIILRVPVGEDNPVQPYGIVGLGVVLWDVDEATILGVNIDTDVDTEFAAKFGGGIDWFVNPNWAINIEGGYVFSEPSVSQTATIGGTTLTASDDIDFSYWYVGGGLKFVF